MSGTLYSSFINVIYSQYLYASIIQSVVQMTYTLTFRLYVSERVSVFLTISVFDVTVIN